MHALLSTLALLLSSQAIARPVQVPSAKKANTQQAAVQKTPSPQAASARTKTPDNRHTLLQGVWSHNPAENAEFMIQGNKVIFVDHDFKEYPVRYRLSGQKLLFDYGNGLVVANTIVKLTRDSLVLANANGGLSRMSKVK